MIDDSPKCLFCDIAHGRVGSYLVRNEDQIMAVLDPFPIRTGHTLIISKAHHPYFDDLPDDTMIQLSRLAQRLGRAMKSRYGVPRVAFFCTGTHIGHAHAHLVPMHEDTDLTSRRYIAEENLTFRPLPREDDTRLAEIAEHLRSVLNGQP
jgi:histidine triad (HIT) family protein